ncbi:MAG TPA: type II toxin-antitoxin system VapC family toxin [Anaerolineae bacterium]
MILADTSIWVDHFRHNNPKLGALLTEGEVACHPFVIGELACGNLKNRQEILSLLHDLPAVPMIDHDEFLTFVDEHRLAGAGLGSVDVHLLASARLAAISLWTTDRRLGRIAAQMHVAHS